MLKKLLIAGGSHSEMPVIQSAKENGWYVITTGSDKNSIGHTYADKYVYGDYSNKEFIYELAKNENVDAIVSGANDFSYLAVSYACEKLGMSGHDTYSNAKKIHIKNEFRETLKQLKIKTPEILKCADLEECKHIIDCIKLPVVVKPVDLTGGKGVRICYNEDEIIKSVEYALKITREKYVIIEEYIDGENYGCSSFIKNGKVIWYAIDSEQYGVNKYLVKGSIMPSTVPQFAEYILINDIELLAKKCNLVDGLFHVQFILSKKDKYPIMIDPCRRIPGDLYILLTKYTTGLDVPAEIVKFETGDTSFREFVLQHNFVAVENIMAKEKGIIKNIFIDDAIKSKIIYSYFRNFKGEKVDNPLTYTAGILILKYNSYGDLIKEMSNFDDFVKIDMEVDND